MSGSMKVIAIVIISVVAAEVALLCTGAQILVSEDEDAHAEKQAATHYCKYFTGAALTVVIFPSRSERISCPVLYRPAAKPAPDIPVQRSAPSMG
jgi:hypothetical protein